MRRRVFGNAKSLAACIFPASDAYAGRQRVFCFGGWPAALYLKSISFDTFNSRHKRLPRGGRLQGSNDFCRGGAGERHCNNPQAEFVAPVARGLCTESWSPNSNETRTFHSLRDSDRLAIPNLAPPFRSTGKRMAVQKIIYVCFDFSKLVSSELALLEMGYDVTTVLGTDGVLALSLDCDYSKVILGDSAVEDREYVEQWLKGNYPDIPVIPMCDLQIQS